MITSDDPDDTAVGPVGEFIVDPDPAVVRAHLVRHYATRHALHLLDPHLAYLTGPRPPAGVRAFRVLDAAAYRERTVAAWIARDGVGTVEIKQRGTPVVPDELRRRLRGVLRGPRSVAATLIVARIGQYGAGVLVQGRRSGPRPIRTGRRGTGRGAVGWWPVSFDLLPAVDVADGRAVRLVQGRAGTETTYGAPLDAALAWADGGAQWIHLVDLDAAFGRGSNAELLAAVVTAVASRGVRVELSGGIRDDASLAAALDTGCTRVNIGTAALEDPAWCASAISRYGERVAVGLDVRGSTLAARGWTQDGGDLWEVLARLDAEGCARYVVTDVTKDGTLRGPNLELLERVCAVTDAPVVASGGVSSLDDLRALAGLASSGVEGAIVGKALYAGAFTLQEALTVIG